MPRAKSLRKLETDVYPFLRAFCSISFLSSGDILNRIILSCCCLYSFSAIIRFGRSFRRAGMSLFRNACAMLAASHLKVVLLLLVISV